MHFLALILAALVTVSPGETSSGAAAGEIAAVRLKSTSSTELELSMIESYTEFTNVYDEVVTYEPAFALTYTNYDGQAAISTNVLGYVDYDYFRTEGGVSKIIAGPTRFDLAITNLVEVGEAPATTVTVTNSIISATVDGITTLNPTNVWWFGGGSFLLTPEDASAQADIIIK